MKIKFSQHYLEEFRTSHTFFPLWVYKRD